jgi:hypothetical protein
MSVKAKSIEKERFTLEITGEKHSRIDSMAII